MPEIVALDGAAHLKVAENIIRRMTLAGHAVDSPRASMIALAISRYLSAETARERRDEVAAVQKLIDLMGLSPKQDAAPQPRRVDDFVQRRKRGLSVLEGGDG